MAQLLWGWNFLIDFFWQILTDNMWLMHLKIIFALCFSVMHRSRDKSCNVIKGIHPALKTTRQSYEVVQSVKNLSEVRQWRKGIPLT